MQYDKGLSHLAYEYVRFFRRTPESSVNLNLNTFFQKLWNENMEMTLPFKQQRSISQPFIESKTTFLAK
jgi:hypothetical protein